MFIMRNITTSLVALLSLLPAPFAAGAAQKVNALSQINWVPISGVGAPAGSCTSSNYGQPYTNRTNGDFYVCAVSGWVLITGGGGGGGLSGQTATYLPKATTSTTSTGPSIISDNGTTATIHGQAVVNDGTANAGRIQAVVGTDAGGTAGYATYSSDTTNGYAEVHEGTAALSRICTAANGVCTAGSATPTWERQGVVMAPGIFEPSPQIQEFSAILGAPEYPGFAAYSQVVKVAFTSGWWPVSGGGQGANVCFAESVDGRSPFVRIGTCITGVLRPALKKFGSTYVLYAVNSSGQANVYTGSTLAGITLASSNVLSCGSHGNEGTGTLAHVEVWSTNNAGSVYNALYDCTTASGFSGSYAIWKATSSGDYKGPWTKGSTTPVAGAGSSNQTTNAADVSGAFVNVQSSTALTMWAHTGPLGIVPTPYIYRYVSTDNGDSWAIDTNPMIMARTKEEGVDTSNGQIANIALLDWPGLSQTYAYLSEYTDGCAGNLFCGTPSYEELLTIAYPLSTVATTSTLSDNSGELGQRKATTVNGVAITGSDNVAALYGGASGVAVADGGSGRAFIMQGQASSTFLGASGTAISSYTDTSLSTYALYASDGTSPQSIPLLDGYNNAIVTTGTTSTFGDVLLSYTPGSADYVVSGAFKWVTSGGTPLAAVFARAASGADTAYQFQCAMVTHVCGTYKHVAGVSTQLGSNVNIGWQVGQTHFLQLKVQGTSIIAFVDGQQILSNTDSAISAVGQAGFRIVGGSGTSISNFNVWVPVSAGGTTGSALTAASSGGAAPGDTFNGSAAKTWDYHTLSAQCALTLTNTGSSGAATLGACSGGAATLNIPNYSGGGGGGAWTNITGSSQVTATGCTQSGSTGGVCTAGGSTSVVTFSVIPGGHTMLRIEAVGVATSGATNGSTLTVNGDTGSNYQRIGDFANGTSALGAITAASQSGCNGGQWSNTGVSEGWFEIPLYASSTLGKVIRGETLNATAANSTTNTQHIYNKCVWLPGSPAAITSVTLTLGANNFASGATFVIWAID